MAGEGINQFLPVPELTKVAIDYDTMDAGFVTDVLAPVVPVIKDSFKYAKWGRETLLAVDRTERAIGAPANRATKISKTYLTGNVGRWSLKDDLADEILQNDPTPEITKMKKVQGLVRRIKTDREFRVKALLDASVNTTAVVNKWEQAATTTIEADVDTAKEAFYTLAGVLPNYIVIPQLVANAIRRNTTVRQLIQYNPNDLLSKGQLPSPLLNMQVIIPGVLSDTRAPGAAASAIGRIWGGKTCYLIYVDPAAERDGQTAIMQFRQVAGEQPFAIKSWRDPDMSANLTWYSTELAQTEIVTAPEDIYTLTGCVT